MDGTSFLEIYKMALSELQDPQIKAIYNSNAVMFCQVMNNFLDNAIPLFTSPIQVRGKLMDMTSPYDEQDSFVGDGTTYSFVLSNPPPVDDVDNVVFYCTVDNNKVNGSYDVEKSTYNIVPAPQEGAIINICYCYAGKFNKTLNQDEKSILSQWLMVCWSEYVQNNKLDIDRLLGDTDFKLTANGPTTQAKTNWYCVNRETVTKRMNKYAWDAITLKLY